MSRFSKSNISSADISTDHQDNLYRQILLAAEKQTGILMSSNPHIGRLSHFLKVEVLYKNNFPALIHLYLRYQSDPQKKLEFATLEKIIKDPAMMPSWETMLEEFGKVPYRLKDQSKDQPDLIHPFDLIAGRYYESLMSGRIYPIKGYTYARTNAAVGDYVRAIEIFSNAIEDTPSFESYEAATEKDRIAKEALLEQVKILKQLKPAIVDIQNKIDEQKELNTREKETLRTALAAFAEIKKIMDEQVIPYQEENTRQGLRFSNFYAYITAQGLDDHKLDFMLHEGTLFPDKPKTFSESDLFNQEALTIMQRIDERFERCREMFIYPSYLLTAHMYYNRAQKYTALVQRLLSAVRPQFIYGMQADCGKSLRHGDHDNANDLTLAGVISFYQNKVKELQAKSLTYATAAVELEKTGNYQAITANTKSSITGLLVLESGKCNNLEEFSTQLGIDIRKQWDRLSEKCRKVKSNHEPPATCRQEVLEIIERHGSYLKSSSKEAATTFVFNQ